MVQMHMMIVNYGCGTCRSKPCAISLAPMFFFRHERSTFLFICSTTSNFNNFKPQQLQPQKRVQNEKKKQNRRPQPRKHTLAPLFFSTIFEVFWIAPEGPPFICFDILQHNGCQKIAKGPPFYIFRHCDTVQKSHSKKFFWEIFSCLQRVPPSIFFKFFATSWSFTKPEGSPFLILSLRYGADFGRSRLV